MRDSICALVACMRKLLHIAYGVLKNKKQARRVGTAHHYKSFFILKISLSTSFGIRTLAISTVLTSVFFWWGAGAR